MASESCPRPSAMLPSLVLPPRPSARGSLEYTAPGRGPNPTRIPHSVVMWSEGAVPEPSEGTPQYEISLYGKFPEERLMYVFIFQYDQTAKKGYVYLPG